VNYALTIRGIVFAAFFSERDGKVKCSFRSKGEFDVNKFARNGFNGGGHKNAAGGALEIPLEEVVKKFKSLLPANLSLLKKA
jgi:phosphoesterase RecJ-like protein